MNILQIFIVILVISLVVFACFPKKKAKEYAFRYDIDKPNSRMEMPQNLKEISGLSFYKENQLACVNDEKGTVFIYDLASQKVIETIDIGKNGDYEGIEVVDVVDPCGAQVGRAGGGGHAGGRGSRRPQGFDQVA